MWKDKPLKTINNKKLDQKKKRPIEEAAERLAEIVIMQIEAKKRSKKKKCKKRS